MREYGEGIGLGIWILCLRALGRPLGPSITETYIYWLRVEKSSICAFLAVLWANITEVVRENRKT